MLDAREQFLGTGNDLFYGLSKMKHSFGFMEAFESEILCGACSASLEPIDWFLTNSVVRAGLDWIAKEVCIEMKIYGGIPSVCKGAIDIMAVDLLPSLAEGVLSPQRVCDEYLHVCKSPHI